jgi:hypothetical protein
MKKLDYKKELKCYYSASAKQPVLVDVPVLHYLAVDGCGNPNTAPSYQAAVEALYSLSYTIKFAVKKGELAVDYGVMPLEGLWWMDDMSQFSVERKDDWQWTLMIMQPPIVTKQLFERCRASLAQKKQLPSLAKLEWRSFSEGKAAQILHVGPFSDEGPTIAKLHAFIASNGKQLSGKHHEIYLTDIRRAAPAKWKTLIRQPCSD